MGFQDKKENMIPKNCVGRKLNKPFKSDRKFKKLQVCVRKGNKVYNPHFGDVRYSDFKKHKDKERRRRFRLRHKCDPISRLDKTKPKYWACQKLW